MQKSKARNDAIDQLGRIDFYEYGRSRNQLDGAVTRMSRFLRHGVVCLAEVRDVAVAKVGDASRCEKFLQELAWRDYFQRVWRSLGDQIWSDIEDYKTGWNAGDYSEEMPADLLQAQTGIDYVDQFVSQLHSTGYLHNHARMWLAAYVVHGRRVKWQAGARWFLSHLIDGDEASNNLSWQWCASTFSNKPYIYNRESIQKFSSNRFAEHQKNDPFDESYDAISQKLFRNLESGDDQKPRFNLRIQPESAPQIPELHPESTLVWVHDGMMSPAHPAIALGQAHLFVWDDKYIETHQHSPARIAFQQSALFCPDVHTTGRSISDVIIDALQAGRFKTIVTGDTADPRLLKTINVLEDVVQVHRVSERPFVDVIGAIDLRRFSRYWSKARNALNLS